MALEVPTGRGGRLKLWHDFYFVDNGKPVICYVDPRQSTGLTPLARDFVFSVMQHNLAQGDFSEAEFRIFHFPKDTNGKRYAGEPYTFDRTRLLPESVINEAIDKTYDMWAQVLSKREEDARKKTDIGSDDLFG